MWEYVIRGRVDLRGAGKKCVGLLAGLRTATFTCSFIAEYPFLSG